MGELIGWAAGTALGLGVVEGRRHWAVRVLCAVVVLVGVPALVVVGLIGGESHWAWDVAIRGGLAFLLVSAVGAIWRGAEWVLATRGSRAGVGAKGHEDVAEIQAASGGGRWAAVGVVAVSVAFVWWLSAIGQSPKAAPVAVPKVDAAPVQLEAAGCDCAAGGVCDGPKGGRYCLRPDGSKKYVGRADKSD